MEAIRQLRSRREISLPEAARRLAVSWRRAYDMCLDGRLEARRVGARWRITLASVRRADKMKLNVPRKVPVNASVLAAALDRERAAQAIDHVLGGGGVVLTIEDLQARIDELPVQRRVDLLRALVALPHVQAALGPELRAKLRGDPPPTPEAKS